MGLTETEATAKRIDYEKGVFPLVASGRALALARSEGFTKLLFDPATQQIIGAGIVGPNAGDLYRGDRIGHRKNCVAQDICLTVHPTPLSQRRLLCRGLEDTITDLYLPRKKLTPSKQSSCRLRFSP